MKREEEEGEEISLHVHEYRSHSNFPATANTGDEYASYIEWQHKIETDKSCTGKLKLFIFRLWGFLSIFEPLWQAALVILVSVGTMYGFTLKDGNLFMGMVRGALAGSITALLLILLWWCTFHFGAFTDSKSKLRYRNAYYAGTVVAYFIVVTLFIVVAVALSLVDKHCAPINKDALCDFKCDIHSVFTGKYRV